MYIHTIRLQHSSNFITFATVETNNIFHCIYFFLTYHIVSYHIRTPTNIIHGLFLHVHFEQILLSFMHIFATIWKDHPPSFSRHDNLAFGFQSLSACLYHLYRIRIIEPSPIRHLKYITSYLTFKIYIFLLYIIHYSK